MEKKKNQLHQLLAVEKDLSNKSEKIVKETFNTFNKKADHFDGLQKVYKPFDDDGEKISPEIKGVVTTVSDKIKYTLKSVVEAINATVSKEETNSSNAAKAELKVGETSFGELSSISLLSLEKTLIQLRALYNTIPTLDPTRIWNRDSTTAQKLYKTSEEIRYRTIKIHEPITLAPATDKHAAQVQLVGKDKQIGQYSTVYKSGRIQPIEKSELLERIDKLIIATKKAKAEANQAEVKNMKVGRIIFEYINGDII